MKQRFNVLIDNLKFPEGPMFDSKGNFWCVEILGGNLVKWNGLNLTKYDVDGTPNCVKEDCEGLMWFSDSKRGEIRTFNVENEQFNTVCEHTTDGNRLLRPNDIIFDSVGNLLFSDHADGRTDKLSKFYVLPKGESSASVISTNKLFSNGLALAANKRTLLLAETYNQQLWIADWNASTLSLTNERPFAKAGTGPWGPDGIAFDSNDNLFVTIFNESKILVYNLEGDIIDEIQTKGCRPTSCCFDPSGKFDLIVTEAEYGQVLSYK